MKLNQSLEDLGETDAQAPEPYSEAWWASLTAEQLHEYVARGFNAGEVFYAAVAETNRREWELQERTRAAAAAEAEAREKEQRRRTLRAALTAGGIILLAAIAGFLII